MWATHSDTVCSEPSKNSSSRSRAGSPSARKNLATSSTPSAADGSSAVAAGLGGVGGTAAPRSAVGTAASACSAMGSPPPPIILEYSPRRMLWSPYILIFALANISAGRAGTAPRWPGEGTSMRYDLAITGSGGAASAAAITARDAGAPVVMIERGAAGGTCVNTGCVPSRALLAAAAARHGAASPRFPGIATQAGPAGMAALAGGKDDLVAAMRAGKYTGLAAGYGWQIIAGTARLAGGPDAPVLQVRHTGGGTAAVEAGQYLAAAGAAPRIPPVSGLAGAGYLTSA